MKGLAFTLIQLLALSVLAVVGYNWFEAIYRVFFREFSFGYPVTDFPIFAAPIFIVPAALLLLSTWRKDRLTIPTMAFLVFCFAAVALGHHLYLDHYLFGYTYHAGVIEFLAPWSLVMTWTIGGALGLAGAIWLHNFGWLPHNSKVPIVRKLELAKPLNTAATAYWLFVMLCSLAVLGPLSEVVQTRIPQIYDGVLSTEKFYGGIGARDAILLGMCLAAWLRSSATIWLLTIYGITSVARSIVNAEWLVTDPPDWNAILRNPLFFAVMLGLAIYLKQAGQIGQPRTE